MHEAARRLRIEAKDIMFARHLDMPGMSAGPCIVVGEYAFPCGETDIEDLDARDAAWGEAAQWWNSEATDLESEEFWESRLETMDNVRLVMLMQQAKKGLA